MISTDMFTIDAHRHPIGNGYKAFPKGVFYGTVNGRAVTAPCASFESAIAFAKKALEEPDGLIASLRDSITCYENNVAQGWMVDELREKIAAEKALLEQLTNG